jgi:hercynylcysteine S-oxide lyase
VVTRDSRVAGQNSVPGQGAVRGREIVPRREAATSSHADRQLDRESDGAEDGWRAWGKQRLPTQFVHLDTAAAGRCSVATLHAVAAHAEREAAAGAYVAEAEAKPVLEAGRAEIASLLGIPAAGVVSTGSATAALAAALAAWPLRPGDTVAATPSEWGPEPGRIQQPRPCGVRAAGPPDGIIDLNRLEAALAGIWPTVVHLTLVASHRPLVQPVADAVAICHAAGVPLWVDAAQALGHVDTACGADLIYATSRKWLAGPRGGGGARRSRILAGAAAGCRLAVDPGPAARRCGQPLTSPGAAGSPTADHCRAVIAVGHAGLAVTGDSEQQPGQWSSI